MNRRSVMKTLQLKAGILILCTFLSFCQLSGQVAEIRPSPELQTQGLRKMALQDASSVNRWWWGWLGGYSAATIGQGIAGISADKLSFRQDMFLSGVTTLVGAVGQLVSPVQPVNLRKWREMENSDASDQTKRDEYLKYLQKMAVAEKKGRGWQMHLASGAVNLGSGLVTWLGFKRTWKDGLVNFALNTVVTEAQIWSQPMKAKKYMLKSSKEDNFPQSFQNNGKPGNSLSIGSSPNGVWLSFRF
jgi:hypothetical protein